MKEGNICPHYQKSLLKIIPENEPHNCKFLACPKCDSSYGLDGCCEALKGGE